MGLLKRIKHVFLNCPQFTLSFLFSYRFLRWWALCTRDVIFPAFCGCESILGGKSINRIFSCHVPFIWHSCPFFFRRHESNIQVFKRWYVRSGQVAFRPNARVLIKFWSFLLSCCYRYGGLCSLPSSGFMNMYMYKFVIVFLFLIVFWAANALVVLRGKPS